MTIWETLGMNKTKNKDEIQEAYRRKLAITNPEDHPEEFMKLREAFESAMREADSPGTEEETRQLDETEPLKLWVKRVDEVYHDFAKRIDPQSWKELLEQEVCQNLDTKLLARSALLDYMLEHFFIPQSVMLLLDRHFGFLENMDELQEEYEDDFLEYVVKDAIKEKEYPPYEYFDVSDPKLPFDEYLLLSARLNKNMEQHSMEECRKILDQMEETGVKTPYLPIERAQVCCQEKNFEGARQFIEQLIPEYAHLETVILLQGDIAFSTGDRELAKRYYRQAQEQDPQSEWARYGIGKCLAAEGDYRQAGEIFEGLLQEDPYNSGAETALKECNQYYKSSLEKDLKQGALDQSGIVDLAWCYYQEDQYDRAANMLEGIEPNQDIKLDYFSVLSRSYVYGSQWDKALSCLEKWKSLLQEEQNITSKESADILSYNYLLQGLVFQNRREWSEAERLLEQALELTPDSGECYQQKAKLFFDMGNYEGAVELCTKAIELGSDFHTVYLLRAEAYYEMDFLGETYHDCDKAISIYPYELSAYILKIKALIESEEFEDAEDILEELADEDVSGSVMEFLRGYMEEEKGNNRIAEKIFRGIINRRKDQEPAGENVFHLNNLAEVYHHLANMNYDEDDENFDPVIDLIDSGLEADSEYVPLLELKADILHNCGMDEDAVELYEQIWSLQPAREEICLDVEDAYRGLEQWDKALEWVQRQIDTKPFAEAYLRKGQVLARLRRLDEAWENLSRALDMKPDLYEVYNDMGLILELRGKPEEAVASYEKAIACGERDGLPCEDAYRNRANFYCREGEFGKCIEMLERGYDKTENSELILEQIEIYRAAGMFDEAMQSLKRYISLEKLKKADFFYNWERAHIERDRGRLDRAYDLYEPEGIVEPAARKEAGKILYYKGKYKKALKFFRKAIERLDKEHDYPEEPYERADYYLWVARTCLKLKDEKDASAFAAEGLRQIPEDFEDKMQYCLPRIYRLKGALCATYGNYEEAERLLKLALEEQKCDLCKYSRCADALYELGYLYELKGQPDQAKRYYREGQRVAPYDSDLAGAVKNIRG